MTNTEIVTIECPNCQSHEKAKVLDTWPFATFIHECGKCDYVIMESEWNCVDKKKDCQHDYHTFFNKGYRKCNKCGDEYNIKAF